MTPSRSHALAALFAVTALAFTGCANNVHEADTSTVRPGSTAAASIQCSGRTVPIPALVAVKLPSLAPCWSAFSNMNFEAFAVAEHRVVGFLWGGGCSGTDSAVVALDEATGREVWKAPPPEDDVSQGITGGGSGVLVANLLTTSPSDSSASLSRPPTALQGIDIHIGAILWRQPGHVAPVANGADVVAVERRAEGGPTGPLLVLDRRTGHELWRLDTGDADIAVGEDALVVADSGRTTAYDARTGVKRWTAAGGSQVVGITGGVVAVFTNSIRAYDVKTGQYLWTSRRAPYGRPADPADGNFYVHASGPPSSPGLSPPPSSSGQDGQYAFAALDARTGRTKWRVATDGSDRSVLAAPALLVDPVAAGFNFIDPASGHVLPRHPPDAHSGGQLTALQTSTNSAFLSYANCLGS